MNLREQLSDALRGNVVVIGTGNRSRGDDAAGSWVAQHIRAARDVYVIDAQEVPEHYVCLVVGKQPDTIVLIDCVDLNSAPGCVAFFDADQTAMYWPSTHRVPLSLLVEYLRRTTQARIFLIAIQPGQTGFLKAMSAEVLTSVESLANLLNDVFEPRRMSPSAACAGPSKQKVSA